MNPPFKQAQKFVTKALEMAKFNVFALLKVQMLESQTRRKWLQKTPLRYVIIPAKRICTARGGFDEEFKGTYDKTFKLASSMMCLCWFIWTKGYTGRPEIILTD